VGVGEGSSLAIAEDNAQKDLIQRLELRLQKNLRTNISKQGSSWLDPFAHLPDLHQTLPRAQMAVSWTSQDGTRHATLVVIDKGQGLSPFEKRVQTLGNKIERLERDGEQALQQEQDPARALALYIKALDAQLESDVLRFFYQLNLARELPQGQKSKTYEFMETIDRLVGSLQLKSIQGNGQQLQPDQTVANPLIAAVQFHVDPVPVGARLMPVRLAWSTGAQTKEVEHRTNEFGLVVIRVDPLGDAREGINQVWVRIDGNKLLSEAGIPDSDPRYAPLIARLNSLRTSFTCLKPGKETTRVALVVTEYIANERNSSSILKDAIRQAINQAGWQVVEAPDDVVFNPGSETELESVAEKLTKILENKADVLICGTIASDIVRIVNDQLVFSSAIGLVMILDVASGNILNRVNNTAKAAGQEVTSANLRALENLTRKTVPIFLEAVRKWKGDAR